MTGAGSVEERLGRIEVKQADIGDSLTRVESGLEKMIDFIRREIDQKELLLKGYVDLKHLESSSQASGFKTDLARIELSINSLGTRVGYVEGWKDRMRGGLMVVNALAGVAGGVVVFLLSRLIH